LKIKVTQEHIDKGERKSERFCPVALALKEQTHERAFVLKENCYFLVRQYVPRKYPMPKEVEEFVSKFDKGEKVDPFSFDCDEEAH
jgi:hypothetical protein